MRRLAAAFLAGECAEERRAERRQAPVLAAHLSANREETGPSRAEPKQASRGVNGLETDLLAEQGRNRAEQGPNREGTLILIRSRGGRRTEPLCVFVFCVVCIMCVLCVCTVCMYCVYVFISTESETVKKSVIKIFSRRSVKLL